MRDESKLEVHLLIFLAANKHDHFTKIPGYLNKVSGLCVVRKLGNASSTIIKSQIKKQKMSIIRQLYNNKNVDEIIYTANIFDASFCSSLVPAPSFF